MVYTSTGILRYELADIFFGSLSPKIPNLPFAVTAVSPYEWSSGCERSRTKIIQRLKEPGALRNFSNKIHPYYFLDICVNVNV